MGQLIPKIIHQIWLGKRPIPTQIQSYMQSWKTYHPDWQFILWTDENLIPLQNQDLYNQVEDLRQKADIVRYEVLYQYGGVYVDIDMECFKNIEPLLQEGEFFVGTEDDFYLSNELMAVTKKHDLIKELLDGLKYSLSNDENKSIDEQTGPIFMTKYLLWMPQVTVAEQQLLYSTPEQLKKADSPFYTVHRAKCCKQLFK